MSVLQKCAVCMVVAALLGAAIGSGLGYLAGRRDAAS